MSRIIETSSVVHINSKNRNRGPSAATQRLLREKDTSSQTWLIENLHPAIVAIIDAISDLESPNAMNKRGITEREIKEITQAVYAGGKLPFKLTTIREFEEWVVSRFIPPSIERGLFRGVGKLLEQYYSKEK